jgi:acetyltransferase
MMEQTKIYKALKGVRGRKPVNLAALEQLMVRFSRLVVEQPWIKEIDINPLLATPERLVALDARIVVHGPEVRAEQLPKPPSGRIRAATFRVDHEGWGRGPHPAHPPGRRAA